ncbi:MAG: hypothetical protein U0T68_00090 [Ferruginibacter sp.]
MAIDKKTSIYFAGGKTIGLETNETDARGIFFNRQADGSWLVNIELRIPDAEAANIVKKFGDLNVTEPEVDSKFPNQVYFEATDSDGRSKYVGLADSKMTVLYDKQEKGNITISMQLGSMSKTQNSEVG